MCICKRSSPKSNTTRTINKNMPPPPPPPPRHASAPDNRGRRSPTTPPAATHDSAGAGRQAPAVSIDQISSILDPFFVDTCQFFKQSSPPPREQQAPSATVGTTAAAAGAAAAAADATTDATANQPWRIENAFLAGVEATADAQSGGAQEGDASAAGGAGPGVDVDDGAAARALQNFLGSGNSAWMETVRDMEEEKNDMLRLDVRSPK